MEMKNSHLVGVIMMMMYKNLFLCERVFLFLLLFVVT